MNRRALRGIAGGERVPLNLNRVRIIIYDLDGTVYDDDRHFELYSREIQSHLPEEVRETFRADYEAVTSGRHASLRIGCFYDADQDLVLIPRGLQVEQALRWDGTALPAATVAALYPEPVLPDHRRFLNVGDLWWVPTAISVHYGGQRRRHQAAFLRVRDLMSSPDFPVRPIPGLRTMLQALRGTVVQVLATNSLQPDSEAILQKVGLMGLFDEMYFQTQKPAGLAPLFDELCRQYAQPPSALLSVGDNLVNEIVPATGFGAQTVYIDPFGTAADSDANLVVPSMVELIPLLEQHFARS